MKYKILITTVTALGLLLSGPAHALLIMLPNGTHAEAQVEGNKLLLPDATGKLLPAIDGRYQTAEGKLLIVKGGVLTILSGGTKSTRSKTKALPVDQGTVPVKATPMPQGVLNPLKATPMPQGTQDLTVPLVTPKDPVGPVESPPPLPGK